jgi:hypothetical protein
MYSIKCQCEGHFHVTGKAEPKIVHLASELYKWFTAMCSERKRITGAYDN